MLVPCGPVAVDRDARLCTEATFSVRADRLAAADALADTPALQREPEPPTDCASAGRGLGPDGA
jgi:hypothetical protein